MNRALLMVQPSLPLRVANWVMLVAFVLSVAVQYNDPDPVRWMSVYGLAAINCLLSIKGRLRWPLPCALGGLALIWALTIAPDVVGKTTVGAMFQAWEMANVTVEESREMGGLLIVTCWMTVLAVAPSSRVPRK